MKMSVIWKNVFWLIVLGIRAVLADVTYTGIECKFNQKICDPSNCAMVNARGKSKYLSASCNFIEQQEALLLNLQLYRRGKHGYERFLGNIKRNFCTIGNTNSDNEFFNRLVSQNLKRIRNLKCPLKGNVTVHRIPLNLQLMQGLFPAASYKMNIIMLEKQSYVINLNISFNVNDKKY